MNVSSIRDVRFRASASAYLWRVALASALVILCCLAAGRTTAAARVTSRAPRISTPHSSTASISTAGIDHLLSRMTLTQRIGQIFMAPIDLSSLGDLIHNHYLGGVILYRANVVSSVQARAFTAAAQRAAAVPLLIATDQEGGEVSELPAAVGIFQMLSPYQYGLIGSADRVYRDALTTGRDLKSLGVNMDLAPVLDVLLDPNSPIGSRSFSPDPALVTRLGTAAIRGYQDAGIAATGKHFLGLGGVGVDAHAGLPVVTRNLPQLEQVELAPIRAAIQAGMDALMVTHAVIPAMDPTGTPASLSRPIVNGFIRGRLGYRGLIITDSLAMGGLSAHIKSIADASVQAIAAGNDMVLISGDAPAIRGAMTAVRQAVLSGRISLGTLDTAARHVLALKAKLGLLLAPSTSNRAP